LGWTFNNYFAVNRFFREEKMDLKAFSTGTTAAAIGSLGTASFAIVDALKTLPIVGVSNAGYAFIQRAVEAFFEGQTRHNANGDVKIIFDTLHGNWINGREVNDQKAIAKSLIKLKLDSASAEKFAEATGVKDVDTLRRVATKMSDNEISRTTRLDQLEMNVLGRFDLGLSAILDDAYQHADQRYRNWAKLAATCVAVILAFLGGLAMDSSSNTQFVGTSDMGLALLAGLLAAPLAPVTKDLASALQAGVKVAQALRS
jgi:hypothetical protein